MIGIDDCAWRRNSGTEQSSATSSGDDRSASHRASLARGATTDRCGSRDRSGGYALAATKALPQATQVADRWQLMENASQAFLDAVRKSMRQVHVAVGSATINLDLLTAAERI